MNAHDAVPIVSLRPYTILHSSTVEYILWPHGLSPLHMDLLSKASDKIITIFLMRHSLYTIHSRIESHNRANETAVNFDSKIIDKLST